MPMPRSVLSASVAAVALVGAAVLPVAPASAAAFVDRTTDCFFEPGDVPGVDVFFPASCTFVGSRPCFGSTGRVTATVSGQVTAVCHL